MLFNSIDFLIFLPIVFSLYWLIFNKLDLKIRNFFLLVASYVFYGWWDWRFLSLIIISSTVDYITGIKIYNSDNDKTQKLWLLLSISVNLGILGFFKYFNFFVENFVQAFSFFGIEFNKPVLNIVLPVGISFYTFQTMSYSIDIYRKQLKPTTDIISFFAYVSFFPQLVAGPIERAKNLLPQFFEEKRLTYPEVVSGLRLMLWGFFKKVVIADNAAFFVNYIFGDYQNQPGSMLLLGAILFAFQIYGDFSGYSDIAIGTARLFGFKLMRNFAYPYFSRDIAEFWRRWHISLSSWFKDYVYIPLGGSKVNLAKRIRNIFIIFIISGFWHGANWTFIVWGALNAAYYLPLMLSKKNRRYLDVVAKGKFLPSLKEFYQMTITFFITVLAWIFFRSQTVADAWNYLKIIFSKSFFTIPKFPNYDVSYYVLFALIFIMLLYEWIHRDRFFGLDFKASTPKAIRIASYVLILVLIFYFGSFKKIEFIYFAF